MEKKDEVLSQSIVVIPALDPDPRLPEYIDALLGRGIAQVVVVNDGSSPERAAVFDSLQATEGCTVLRHKVNRGKGRALKTAFSYILSREEWKGMVVVTADADGQHTASDVCAVARATAKGPDRLVLGVRDLGLPNVPTRSKIGNRLTSWAFHLFYGARLEDTQTGLRGIPWTLLPWCVDIAGERFEYEMNVLIQTAHDHMEPRQIPIQTIYYNNNAGTHLRALQDSTRVLLTLLAGLGWYMAAASLSAVADVLTFWLGSAVLFRALAGPLRYWWATLTDRALSSALNYTLNRKYVFGAKPRRRTVFRYYCLWVCQLLCSYLLLLFMTTVLPAFSSVVSKMLVDILLALVSYQIQMRWVFKEEGDHGEG